MTISQKIKLDINLSRLAGSYIIQTDNTERATSEAADAIRRSLFGLSDSADKEGHPDLVIINKAETAKAISVEQIRHLQQFLYKTSIITGKKVAIITDADQMNINAANCSLKMLEDTPSNTYIFLIVKSIAHILPTIKSRCAKITHIYERTTQVTIDEQYLAPLLKSTAFKERLNFIKGFADKDRKAWAKFVNVAEELLCQLTRKVSNCEVSLSSLEQEILSQFSSKSLSYLLHKYQEVKGLIENTDNFDLDLQTSCILLIEHFRS